MFQTVYSALLPRLEEVLNEEQRIILHLYLAKNKGIMEIAEQLNVADYHIIKDELKIIELKISALG